MTILYTYSDINIIIAKPVAFLFNPFMPNGAFNICTSGAPLKPLRVDSALSYTRSTYIIMKAKLTSYYNVETKELHIDRG